MLGRKVEDLIKYFSYYMKIGNDVKGSSEVQPVINLHADLTLSGSTSAEPYAVV